MVKKWSVKMERSGERERPNQGVCVCVCVRVYMWVQTNELSMLLFSYTQLSDEQFDSIMKGEAELEDYVKTPKEEVKQKKK